MASNRWNVTSGETSVAAATTQTILQVKAANTNVREKLNRCKISIRGGAGADAPVLVELLRQTSAGTASSATVKKENPDAAETLQATAQQTFTAEPAAGAILDYRYLSPVAGEVIFTLGPEGEIPGNASAPGGNYIGVRVTTQSGVSSITVKAEMEGDE